MTRRERLERKLEKRRDWAVKAETKADSLSKQSHDMISVIPMGQPILVKHSAEANLGDFGNPNLYHVAVKISRD